MTRTNASAAARASTSAAHFPRTPRDERRGYDEERHHGGLGADEHEHAEKRADEEPSGRRGRFPRTPEGKEKCRGQGKGEAVGHSGIRSGVVDDGRREKGRRDGQVAIQGRRYGAGEGSPQENAARTTAVTVPRAGARL